MNEAPIFEKESDAPAWRAWIEALLARADGASAPRCLDLFAGAGGLGMGFRAAGWRVTSAECDADCVRTLEGEGEEARAVRLSPGLDWAGMFGPCEVLVGGPPCQPYSRLGNRMGAEDPRDGVPAFLDALETLRPRLFVMENVPGMVSSGRVLDVVERARRLGYAAEAHELSAEAYGVPQKRRRAFVVGSSRPGWAGFLPPAPFVGRPVTVAAALGRAVREIPEGAILLTPAMDAYVARYEAASGCRTPRDLDPSRPSRTVTCRNLASATSDMLRLRLPDGRRRMLLPSEGALLQGFPPSRGFAGSPASVARQVGNAVPPPLALAVARGLIESGA